MDTYQWIGLGLFLVYWLILGIMGIRNLRKSVFFDSFEYKLWYVIAVPFIAPVLGIAFLLEWGVSDQYYKVEREQSVRSATTIVALMLIFFGLAWIEKQETDHPRAQQIACAQDK